MNIKKTNGTLIVLAAFGIAFGIPAALLAIKIGSILWASIALLIFLLSIRVMDRI